MPFSRIAVISLMRGRSVAMALWQIMQVRTLGRPATGPVVTLSWQYSVQAICLPTWMLCGNSIGWTGSGCRTRKSSSATRRLGRAVVSTARDSPGSPGPASGGGGVVVSM